jgi:DNA-binding CsgD family transcriptional regulator
VLEDTRESNEPDRALREMERLRKGGQGMTTDEMASALAGGA